MTDYPTMRRYCRPWGWPVLPRRLYDTKTSLFVWSTKSIEWTPDPASGYLYRLRGIVTEFLFVSHSGRWFVVRTDPVRDRLIPMPRWRARLWLLKRAAPPELVRRYFPHSFAIG